jgi:ATP-dependent Clp protease ATP-binding subunit ClpA
MMRIYIERDPASKRRVQPVLVGEPSVGPIQRNILLQELQCPPILQCP